MATAGSARIGWSYGIVGKSKILVLRWARKEDGEEEDNW
jgi:hypothetical protein